MLIVQRITTEWTKDSRGGEGAIARNTTPDAMELPPLAGRWPSYLLHDVRFLEWERFDCLSTVTEADMQSHMRIEPLFLHVTPDHVAVSFVWSWQHCGAPERDSHSLFQLSVGQWGQFSCNGRFGAESAMGREWSYHKTVFNIAHVATFNDKLFVESTPHARDSRLAVLK